MLDNLKKKLKEFRLRDVFRRKALPPVPPEILNNKPLTKAIVRQHRRKVVKRLRNVFLASAALSAVLQSTPDLVSTKFDDYMAGKGFANNFSQNYSTGEIRVYDRFNPLYPFHLAGREVSITWHEQMKLTHLAAIPLAIETPLLYVSGLEKGFGDMIFPNSLDAYSMTTNDKLNQRVNFIRPPGEFSLDTFLQTFSQQDGSKLSFRSDRKDLQDVLFAFVMLHEARHGDQEKRAYITANEADADLYAFKVLESRGFDPVLVDEARTIVRHARTLSATLGSDQAHVSTFTLERGGERIFDAYEDAADFKRLHDVLREADIRNDRNFPRDMPAGNRYLYLTLAMQKAGLLNEDPGMKKAAAALVAAVNYFDDASGHKIIDPNFDFNKINLRYLTQPYHPAPDRLDVPAPPAPKPGV